MPTRRRFVQLILICGGALLLTTTALALHLSSPRSQDTAAAGNSSSPLGTNLGLVTDFSTQLPFVDAFKMARTWIPRCVYTRPHPDPGCNPQNASNTGEASSIAVDENGWVTALPTPEDTPIFTYVVTLLLLGDAGGLNQLGGQYIVLYEGEGEIEYGGGANKNEDASGPGRDVVDVLATGFVQLMITETDPNQTGDYIRNIRFIRPEYEETYEAQPFNPVFLNKAANFSVLRFMPWMRTNDEPTGEWAERSQVDDYTYTTNNGVPLEVMLDLANRTQAHPWFNMPHMATDEYMTEFATMVRDSLSVTSQVVVEYSNETWNVGLPQARWVNTRGLAEFETNNPVQAGLNWHGKRAAEMCEIWKTVWGEQSERVICVAASQAANSWTAEQVLTCPLWTEGAPCVDHGIDALAIAPYFAGYVGHHSLEVQVLDWTAAPDGGLDQLFTELITGGELMGAGVPTDGSLQQAYRRMSANKTVAETHGVELIAYEGGQHLVQTLDLNDSEDTYSEAVTELFTNANRDPRMGQIYSQYLTEWRNRGGCLFVNFTLVQREYIQFGSWGILEYINQESSPKYEAVMNFIDDNPWPWENCTLLTTTKVIFLPSILNWGAVPDNCCAIMDTDSRSLSKGIPSAESVETSFADGPPTWAVRPPSSQAWLTGVGITVDDPRFAPTCPTSARLPAAPSPAPFAAQPVGLHLVDGPK